MNKNKRIILFLILLLIALYVFVTFIFTISKGKIYRNTVFIGNETKVELKNNNIKIYKEKKSIKKQPVKIYFKKEFLDGFISFQYDKLSGEGKFDLTNSKHVVLYPNTTFIAHTPDISIDIKDGESYDSKDLTDLYQFANLNDISIDDYSELDYQEITKMDIDEDGKEEYIYSVGLIYYSEDEEDDSNNKYESYVFLKKDGKYFIIDRVDSDSDQVAYIKLSFTKLIDFNKDGNYEFVVEKAMSEYGPYYYELYNFDGSKFTKIGGE